MDMLVENCQRININELLKSVEKQVTDIKLESKLSAHGQKLQITTTKCHFGGYRHWFMCSRCCKRVGNLYRKPGINLLLCRKCSGLKYLKSRYHKMV